MSSTETRRRSRRLELRLTSDERDFIERAAAAISSSITEFVVGSAVIAAQRVLADQARFELDASAVAGWETINDRQGDVADRPPTRA